MPMEIRTHGPDPEKRDAGTGFWNGLKCRCPKCGTGALFAGYLKVAPQCDTCGEDLSGHRADDAPPYFTILISGHFLVPIVMWVEVAYWPPIWMHFAISAPFLIITSLLLLRPVKGAIVGMQWAFRMHGFGEEEDDQGNDGQRTGRLEQGS